MTEVDWISTANLMAGGPARVGMSTQQRAVHVRLAGVLPAVRYERAKAGQLPQAIDRRAPRAEERRT